MIDLQAFYQILNTIEIYFFLCAIFLTSILYFFWLRREKNLPPGPICIPLVGYLPFLGKKVYETLHKLTKIYGPIYSLYLGRRLVIVLGNFKVVKEALANSKLIDRPPEPPQLLLPNSLSFSVVNGKMWKEQRQFSIQLLRQLGMVKQAMKEHIQNEIQKLVVEIDKKNGKNINLDDLLYPSVAKHVLNLLIGKTLDFEDQNMILLKKTTKNTLAYLGQTRIHAFYPWIRYWLTKFKIMGYHTADYFMGIFGQFIQDQIDQHRKKIEQSDPKDYVEGYLKVMNSIKEGDSSFSEEMLRGNFQVLFSAGSSPSTAAIEWSILFMAMYPDIQKVVHYELDSVLGPDRPPSWEDSSNLPYTQAVIFEAIRRASVVPVGMLRCTSERTKIAGYDIPKNAMIICNLWGVHHDAECWEEPFSFKPERFLRDGKVYRPQEFIPFSYGRRNCPGADMAMMIVFLYFSSLMQRYTISMPDSNNEIQEILGIARIPVVDKLQMTIRN